MKRGGTWQATAAILSIYAINRLADIRKPAHRVTGDRADESCGVYLVIGGAVLLVAGAGVEITLVKGLGRGKTTAPCPAGVAGEGLGCALAAGDGSVPAGKATGFTTAGSSWSFM